MVRSLPTNLSRLSTCWLDSGGIRAMRAWMRGNESGSILLWVMVIGLFTVGALGAATRLVPAGRQVAVQDKDTTYAFIAAESGINYVVHLMESDGLEKLKGDWFTVGGYGGEYKVETSEGYVYVTGKFGDA